MSPEELRDATAPRPEELSRLVRSLDPALLEACAEATAPTSAERLRLRPRALPARSPWRGPLLLALALLALVLVRLPEPSSHAPVSEQASIVPVEQGALRLLEQGPGRRVLRLDQGEALLDTGLPPARSLVLRTPELQLSAEQARFRVWVTAEEERVLVERGQLRLVDRLTGAVLRLRAGESWRRLVAPLASAMERIRPVFGPQVEPALRPRALPEEPLAESTSTPEPPPQADPGAPARAFAALLDRREAGESSAALVADVDAFVGRWPDSPLVEELAVLRVEVLAERLPPAQAIAELQAWARAWPDSPRRAELHLLIGNLARDGLHDCELAWEAYTVALEGSSGELAEQARTGRGLCLE